MRSERGGILGGLLVTGLVMICLVIGFGLFVARNIHVVTTQHNGGDDVSIDTPAGHLTVRAHEKAGTTATDIPIYPGSRPARHESGGDAVIQWSSNDGKIDTGFSVSGSESVTSDPLDKVVDYYRGQLPNWIVTRQRNSYVKLELRDGGYKRIIGITERSDGTHIAVASVGEPASN